MCLLSCIIFSIGYIGYGYVYSVNAFDLIVLFSRLLNMIPSYTLIVILELHIVCIVLYVGNVVVQKKAKRVNRLYEGVRKE